MYGSRPQELRPWNAEAVLQSVLRRPSVSRADVARELRMSQPTVLDIVDRFIAGGVLREVGTNSSGGRPGVALDIVAEAARVIAVDLGGTYVRVGVFGFDRRLAHSTRLETDTTSREAVLRQIVDQVQQARSFDRASDRSFHCLVVGAPGYVRDGTVLDAPNLPDWIDVPLQHYLELELGIPVIVENDVDLAAVGEAHYGAGRDCADIACVAIGTGFGAGIIANKKLVRGMTGAAGEAAFIVPGPELLDRSFGRTGALETFAAMAALPRHAPEGSALQSASPTEIIAAARRHEDEATATLYAWTRYVAIGLIAIGAICNPETIVIGGGGGVGAYDLIEGQLIRYLQSHLPVPPRLACAQLGDEATLWGSLVLGLGAAVTHLAAKSNAGGNGHRNLGASRKRAFRGAERFKED